MYNDFDGFLKSAQDSGTFSSVSDAWKKLDPEQQRYLLTALMALGGGTLGSIFAGRGSRVFGALAGAAILGSLGWNADAINKYLEKYIRDRAKNALGLGDKFDGTAVLEGLNTAAEGAATVVKATGNAVNNGLDIAHDLDKKYGTKELNSDSSLGQIAARPLVIGWNVLKDNLPDGIVEAADNAKAFKREIADPAMAGYLASLKDFAGRVGSAGKRVYHGVTNKAKEIGSDARDSASTVAHNAANVARSAKTTAENAVRTTVDTTRKVKATADRASSKVDAIKEDIREHFDVKKHRPPWISENDVKRRESATRGRAGRRTGWQRNYPSRPNPGGRRSYYNSDGTI